jgi:hypothetical protein
VEADILLEKGTLYVGHGRGDIRPERTFEALYLAPLRARAARHEGRIYPDGPSLTLLVDIKTDAVATYNALRALLERYAPMLTRATAEGTVPGAVTVIVSGNRPIDLMTAEIAARGVRYGGIDGRTADLGSTVPAHLMPLISENWWKLFTWQGTGPMPDAERRRLRDIVARAHAAGRRVRFWGIPHNETLWQELFDAGVDLINADDLARLRAFLLQRGAGSEKR